MTCRHGPGDINCSSHPENIRRNIYENQKNNLDAKELAFKKRLEECNSSKVDNTPDSEKYEVVEVERVGLHLVMKVRYPNCSACSYEGNKVLVYLNVTEKQVLKWRRIDPHFRSPESVISEREAPGPNARFPASSDGWEDAVRYAGSK